jgi:hypothetical protein
LETLARGESVAEAVLDEAWVVEWFSVVLCRCFPLFVEFGLEKLGFKRGGRRDGSHVGVGHVGEKLGLDSTSPGLVVIGAVECGANLEFTLEVRRCWRHCEEKAQDLLD